MSVYTPTATNQTSYTEADDGDDRDAASNNVFLEALADKAAWLEDGATQFSGSKEFLDDVTFEQQLYLEPTATIEFSSEGVATPRTVNIAGGIFGFNETGPIVAMLTGYSLPVTATIFVPIVEIPHGATLTNVSIQINPADDALPTTNFSMQLVRKLTTAAAPETVWTQVDTLTGAAYQASHSFQSSQPDHVFDRAYSYYLALVGEAGGDEDAVLIEGPPLYSYSLDGINIVGLGKES